MADRRRRKTAAERRQERLYMSQLLGDGITGPGEIDLPIVGQEPLPLEITQAGGGIIRTSSGDPQYEIAVRMVAAEQIQIADYSFTTSFDPETIDLPHLTAYRGYYPFAKRQYRAGEILNDYLDGTFVFKRNAVLEGLILAQGFVEVPSEIRSATIRLQLMVVDVLGRECEANLLLKVVDQTGRRNSQSAANPLAQVDKAADQVEELPHEEAPPVDQPED